MEFYTVSEIQTILRLGRRTAYRLVNSPECPKVRIGKKILIPQNDFEKFIEGKNFGRIDL